MIVKEVRLTAHANCDGWFFFGIYVFPDKLKIKSVILFVILFLHFIFKAIYLFFRKSDDVEKKRENDKILTKILDFDQDHSAQLNPILKRKNSKN